MKIDAGVIVVNQLASYVLNKCVWNYNQCIL